MVKRSGDTATLVARPEVLFLDESTTGLDPWARNDLWETLDAVVAEVSRPAGGIRQRMHGDVGGCSIGSTTECAE